MGLEEVEELISFLVLIPNIPLFQSSNNPVQIFHYSNWGEALEFNIFNHKSSSASIRAEGESF